MVDPLSNFSIHPVFPICGMMHIKESLMPIGKYSSCGGSGFLLSLSELLRCSLFCWFLCLLCVVCCVLFVILDSVMCPVCDY